MDVDRQTGWKKEEEWSSRQEGRQAGWQAAWDMWVDGWLAGWLAEDNLNHGYRES